MTEKVSKLKLACKSGDCLLYVDVGKDTTNTAAQSVYITKYIFAFLIWSQCLFKKS